MPAYKVPDGVLGVGFDDVTYVVQDGVLVLPDGVDLGDVGDGYVPMAAPAGVKPKTHGETPKRRSSKASEGEEETTEETTA